MKVKILYANDYEELEEKFNTFSLTVDIVEVKHWEMYDIEKDIGVVAYHVFYKNH